MAAPHLLYLLFPLSTAVKHLGFVDWQRITFNQAQFDDLVRNRAPQAAGRAGDRAPHKPALPSDPLVSHISSFSPWACCEVQLWNQDCLPFGGTQPIHVALGRHAVYLCTALGCSQLAWHVANPQANPQEQPERGGPQLPGSPTGWMRSPHSCSRSSSACHRKLGHPLGYVPHVFSDAPPVSNEDVHLLFSVVL